MGGIADSDATSEKGATACRCFFVHTGEHTIAITLDGKHTSVDRVQAQVHEREGIPPEHQCLVYDGKQLTRGDLRLEDYGVTEQATLRLLGIIRGGMLEGSRDGSSSSKRPHLAFEDPMDVDTAGQDPLYAQWKAWFETCAPIATAFLSLEAKAAEALGYRERATR